MTARDFAQTLELCRRLGSPTPPVGTIAGSASRRRPWAWPRARRRSCAGRAPRRRAAGPFDLALGHGSNDVTVAAALLGIPSSTMFDYEWATVQHNINCRLARAVVVPDAIPPAAPVPLRREAASCTRYEGLKEEYYLADFEPDRAVLAELALDARAPDRGRAHPARGVPLPPLRERPLRRACSSAWRGRRRGRRAGRGAAARRARSATQLARGAAA